MQITYDLLKNMAQMLDKETDKSAYTELVTALDARTKLLLESLGYDPEHERIPLFKQTDEERLAAAKKDDMEMLACPIIGLPYAVTAISDAINKDVRQDLLAFATDFEYKGLLSFRISFRVFGPNMLASSLNQVSGEKEGMAKLEELADQGYVFEKEKGYNGYALLDYPKNRELVTAYCKERFGAEWIEISTVKDKIDEVFVRMDPSSYKFPAQAPAVEDENLSTITPDEMVRLKKAVSNYQFALSGYKQMSNNGSGNVVLCVISSYMYEIEQIIEVHASIWEMKEMEYSKSRAINGEIHNIREGIKTNAMKAFQVSGRDFYRLAEKCLSIHVKPLGLYLDEFKLMEHELIQMTLSHSSTLFRQVSFILDGQKDPYDDRAFYAYDSQKNIDTINRHLQEVMPGCEVDSFEVNIRNGARVLWRVTISCRRPSDLKSLIEKVDVKKKEEDNMW